MLQLLVFVSLVRVLSSRVVFAGLVALQLIVAVGLLPRSCSWLMYSAVAA